jgi:CTP synthase (UTP-ammonia lyase)
MLPTDIKLQSADGATLGTCTAPLASRSSATTRSAGRRTVIEPFYCSHGVNPALEGELEGGGLHLSGRDDHGSPRVIELDDHPFFITTLYVFQARDDRKTAHPLTAAFIDAARAARSAA